jgi:hypothetical protein
MTENQIRSIDQWHDYVGREVEYTEYDGGRKYNFIVKSVELNLEIVDNEIRFRGSYLIPTNPMDIMKPKVFTTNCKLVSDL